MSESDSSHGIPQTVEALQNSLAAAATAHVHDNHRAPCVDGTRTLFSRMDCHGVGEDLNQAVRSLAIATHHGRQLVLLPPPRHHVKLQGASCQSAVRTTAAEPWHWLAGQNVALGSVLLLSSCQERLMREAPAELEALALANSSEFGRARRRLRAALGFNTSEARNDEWVLGASIGRSWRINIGLAQIPRIFHHQGTLWWFQVLTTYFVRIQRPLSTLLEAQQAMRPYVARMPQPASSRELQFAGWTSDPCSTQHGEKQARHGVATGVVQPRGTHLACARAGWAPSARFDVGLHLREGDACRAKGRRFKQMRMCGLNLSAALLLLRRHGVSNGTLFVATDSPSVIDDLRRGLAAPFVAYHLPINRSRFETAGATEGIGARSLRRQSLLESLMDILLLSRSTVIAAKMMSNFGRAALQLRVQPPATLRYVALDERPWCSRTSCRLGAVGEGNVPAAHAAAPQRLSRGRRYAGSEGGTR